MICRNLIATTVPFAIACGLDPDDNTASGILPPADEIELIDRRNLWYGITMYDNCLSYGNGTTQMELEKVRNRCTLCSVWDGYEY